MTGLKRSAGKAADAARQFPGFVLVGGFAALMNWGSRILLSASGLSLSAAVVIAYLIGMAVAFVLLRCFVFESSGRTVRSEATRFVVINLLALLVVWGVTILMDRFVLPAIGWSWNAESVAHGVGVASPVFTSYFGHRWFTFGRAPSG